jgi:hypothetical protein
MDALLTGLWKKLHAAQDAKNADAAIAYKNAIERANKGKIADAEWWANQGDEAMPVATEKSLVTR